MIAVNVGADTELVLTMGLWHKTIYGIVGDVEGVVIGVSDGHTLHGACAVAIYARFVNADNDGFANHKLWHIARCWGWCALTRLQQASHQ